MEVSGAGCTVGWRGLMLGYRVYGGLGGMEVSGAGVQGVRWAGGV